MTTPTEIGLFAYGTLQPGEPLHGWVAVDVIDSVPATLVGHTLVWQPGGAYPWLVEGGEEGNAVRGTLLWMRRRSAALDRTIAMERDAGYRVLPVVVLTDDEELVECLTFVYPGVPRGAVPLRGQEWKRRLTVIR